MAQMNEEDLEESFRQCVCWGYLECMEFLFPHCQHISMEQAMVVAAQKGSTACLKWLLDHANVDPTYNYSEALAQACNRENTECVDLLYPLSNPHEALSSLQLRHPNFPSSWEYLEEKMALEQKTMLAQTVENRANNTHTHQRKM